MQICTAVLAAMLDLGWRIVDGTPAERAIMAAARDHAGRPITPSHTGTAARQLLSRRGRQRRRPSVPSRAVTSRTRLLGSGTGAGCACMVCTHPVRTGSSGPVAISSIERSGAVARTMARFAGQSSLVSQMPRGSEPTNWSHTSLRFTGNATIDSRSDDPLKSSRTHRTAPVLASCCRWSQPAYCRARRSH
jgi:hypothetical protein